MSFRPNVSNGILCLPLAYAWIAVAPAPVGTQAKANNP